MFGKLFMKKDAKTGTSKGKPFTFQVGVYKEKLYLDFKEPTYCIELDRMQTVDLMTALSIHVSKLPK